METGSNQISTEQIISAVHQLSLPELERVFDHVLMEQAERKAAHLSVSETALLERINTTLPTNMRERFIELKEKRANEKISAVEYSELTSLSNQCEEIHANRMAALVELAKVRGLSLNEVMDQLGIQFPENV